jgi:hypothetical protein
MVRKISIFVILAGAACLVGSVLSIIAAYAWVNLHPQPKPISQTLFRGVDYVRLVRQSPRPMVIHVVKVDLQQPGIGFLVTPGDPDQDLPLKARTTSQFLKEFKVQIAINGDGFTPWWSNSIFDYYPHSGDRVEPIGLAASRGTIYSDLSDNEPVLYIARTNRARFNTPIGKIHNAISGNLMLVEQGRPVTNLDSEPQPRTAVALDKSGRRLIIVVVDGRQPRYSQGATLAELAEIILEQGGHFGINMDGGGSTTLVKMGANGKPVLLNSPIEHQIPGRQRPVGNHLGIFAEQVGADE